MYAAAAADALARLIVRVPDVIDPENTKLLPALDSVALLMFAVNPRVVDGVSKLPFVAPDVVWVRDAEVPALRVTEPPPATYKFDAGARITALLVTDTRTDVAELAKYRFCAPAVTTVLEPEKVMLTLVAVFPK